MGINQDTKNEIVETPSTIHVSRSHAVSDVTIYNLHSTPLVLPGSYHTSAIPVEGSATFGVPDVDKFLTDSRVLGLVAGGHIQIANKTTEAIPVESAASTAAPIDVHDIPDINPVVPEHQNRKREDYQTIESPEGAITIQQYTAQQRGEPEEED